MLQKIINTFTSNVFIALLNLLIAVIISQYLGAEGKGEQSIFITNIALVLLVCNIAGGASLVYLVPRYDNLRIIWPAYVWTILVISALYFFIVSIEGIRMGYTLHLCLLTVISSFTAINSTILLGHERIKAKNIIAVLQALLIFSTLFFLFTGLQKKNFESYIISLYIGYSLSFLISFIFIFPYIRRKTRETGDFKQLVKMMFRYGILNQLGHIFHLLSFRLSYYILLLYMGREEVGIYSNGVALVESVWLISRSIATVQYARIANTTDIVYAQNLTVKLLKAALIMSVIVLTLISLLPSSFYTTLFGEDFGSVNIVIRILAPGILFHNISLIIGHYFSGRAQYHINTYSALSGLLVTAAMCLIFIPVWGIYGAAFAAVISMISMSMIVLLIFRKSSGLPFKVFLPSREDFAEVGIILRTIFKGSGN